MNCKFIALIILALCSIPSLSFAEIEWIFAGDTKKIEVYVDLTSIRRDDDLVLVRELIRYKENKTTSQGIHFVSVVSYVLYDCINKKQNILNMTFHEDWWGKNNPILEYKMGKQWSDVKPKSVVSESMSIACDGTQFKIL